VVVVAEIDVAADERRGDLVEHQARRGHEPAEVLS
jgi:hypothetical protein